MTSNAIWHGTEEELRRLAAAVAQNCSCTTELGTQTGRACATHAIFTDERVLNHLLFVRRTWRQFESAEWSCAVRPEGQACDRW